MRLLVVLTVLSLAALCLADGGSHNGRNGRRRGRARQGRRQNNNRSNLNQIQPQAGGITNFPPAPPLINTVPELRAIQNAAPIPIVPRRGVKSGDATVVSQQGQQPDEFGNYNFNFQTSDGVQRSEFGQQRQSGNDQVNEISGDASWTDNDGNQVAFTYIANENGYQPSNLPTQPPIPPAIQRGLDLIARANRLEQQG